MSTKIYEAYRIKKGLRLFDVVQRIRWEAEKNVKTLLLEMFDRLCDSAYNSPKYKEIWSSAKASGVKDPEKYARRHVAESLMRDGYRDQLGRSMRSGFDYDVSVTVHSLNSRYYLIPFCGDGLHGALDFLRKSPDLEDFAYWDNTDEPDNVTPKEWGIRARTWDRIWRGKRKVKGDGGDGWWDQLVLEIVSWGAWYRFNPAYYREMEEMESCE